MYVKGLCISWVSLVEMILKFWVCLFIKVEACWCCFVNSLEMVEWSFWGLNGLFMIMFVLFFFVVFLLVIWFRVVRMMVGIVVSWGFLWSVWIRFVLFSFGMRVLVMMILGCLFFVSSSLIFLLFVTKMVCFWLRRFVVNWRILGLLLIIKILVVLFLEGVCSTLGGFVVFSSVLNR